MSGHDVLGMGAVTAVGGTVAETFAALCAGSSGRGPYRAFEPERFRGRHAYEIDDRPDGRDVPRRASRLLTTAIAEAVRDAGIDPDLSGVPVLVGTGLRESRSVEIWWADGTRIDDDGWLDFGADVRAAFGPAEVHTFSNACSASLHALALGADLLDLQQADTVVVAGVDVLVKAMSGLMDRVQLDSPDRLRPFDRDRKGVLLGEGAAAVVLRRRGAGTDGRRPAARLRGVGMTCDAAHPTAPDRTGIELAIRDSHTRAGVGPADIDLVVLHGTGTPLNDAVEAQAMAGVYGPHLGDPLMTAVKAVTGHTAGASGLVSLIAAVCAMRSGRVPHVFDLEHRMPETEGFRLVTGAPEHRATSMAQVNAFGFGGVNAVAVVEGVR